MRFVVVGLCLLLAACASGPKGPQGKYRTIGVISAMGDQFHHRQVSRAASDEKTSPLQPWAIDAFVTAQAGALLAKRYQVRPVTAPAGAFAPDKIHFPGERSPQNETRRPIEEVVRAEVQPQGLDAYVVLTRGFAPFADTKQIVRGVGVAKADRLAEGLTYLHALYWITVIDGGTFRIVGDAKALPVAGLEKPQGAAADLPAVINGPAKPTDAAFAVDSLTHLSPARQDRLKRELQELLVDSLPDSLRAVKLLD